MSSELLTQCQEAIDYWAKWYRFPVWAAPDLHFVDMGQYGTMSYFEHFRDYADSESVSMSRDSLMKGVYKWGFETIKH